jgi:alkaline phosphatase D
MPRNLLANPRFGADPFTLGVASGDPASDGFVLWTRLAPRPLEPLGGMEPRPVAVRWEVAGDARFQTLVAQGEALAHPELAHSVHVEVAGLAPDRPYWYRFRVGREESAVGRTRTLPAPGARVERLRFVAAGCQHYEQGLFTAWRHIAQEPVDFVFHYGDYIYESADHGAGPFKANGRTYDEVRRHVGGEIYTLDDYRRRYALYKSDPDLQAAHAAVPFWMSFDDHEVDNNWASDFDQDGTPPKPSRSAARWPCRPITNTCPCAAAPCRRAATCRCIAARAMATCSTRSYSTPASIATTSFTATRSPRSAPKPLPSAASWARRRNAGSTMAWPPPTRGGT